MGKNIPFDRQSNSLLAPPNQTMEAVTLPLLISVPHGGYSVPIDILPYLSLDFRDIFPDSDPCTRAIYGFKDHVYYYHDTDIARAIVDLNRAVDDLPPHNPDGVVKSETVMRVPVYRSGNLPDEELTKDLLERYYYPYHEKIERDLKDPALLCGLDCHSMLEIPPNPSNSKERERPFICLSNCGDANGDGGNELSCPPDFINLLADCLRTEFPDEADQILLNQPFKGGQITRLHSRQIPWIQMELNRRAYVKSPWFDADSLEVDNTRLEYLRDKLLNALTSFCEEALTSLYHMSTEVLGEAPGISL